MEMFNGGKWQRQPYFSFILGVVAQFFKFYGATDISSQARGQNFSSVEAEVVAHDLTTNTQQVN